jgi:hypothetical protein
MICGVLIAMFAPIAAAKGREAVPEEPRVGPNAPKGTAIWTVTKQDDAQTPKKKTQVSSPHAALPEIRHAE